MAVIQPYQTTYRPGRQVGGGRGGDLGYSQQNSQAWNPQRFSLPTGDNSGFNPYGNNNRDQWSITPGRGYDNRGGMMYPRNQGRNLIDDSRLPTNTGGYQPLPLPGQPGEPNKEQPQQSPYYNPTYPTYTPGQYNTGTQATPGQFNYYPGLDPVSLQPNDEREAALQAVQASLPIAQFNQNAYQYGLDFNEAQRRWNEQFGYQQGLDQFNMGLSTRQQQMAEWQAQQAAQQWAQDYARQTGNDQWNREFSQQQFGLQDYAQREQLRQSEWLNQQRMANEGRGLDIQAQQNEINRAYNEGRLSNEQRQIALAELTQQQQNTLNQQRLGLDTTRAQQEYELGQGRLGVDRDQLAYQNQWNMGRLGLDERTQNELNVYRQQQLQQERDLLQQRLAAEAANVRMQQFGRNQAPNMRWIRNW